MTDYTCDPRTPVVAQMATAGMTREQVACQLDVSTQTVSRMAKAAGAKFRIPGGGKIGKKPKYLARVLELHDGGKSVGEIVADIGDIHDSTVGEWLRQSGRTPKYSGDLRVPAAVEDHPLRAQAIRRYLAGETGPAVSKSLGLNERTVEYWAKQDGVWGQGGIYKRQQDAAVDAIRRYRAGDSIASIIAGSREGGSRLDFYQVRMALDAAGVLPYPDDEKPDVWCPCGRKTGHPGRAYCSPGHRKEYGIKRQADPANQVTFTCQRPACGKEFTLPRSYASAGKYCSNECSAKHNRTKQHIVIEDAMVLDSPYEALLYGLLRLWKITVERADRNQAISFTKDVGDLAPGDEVVGYDLLDSLGTPRATGDITCWYCPDFWLPDLGTWIEVKGFEDDDDRTRYDEWRKAGRVLAVLGRLELHALRTCLTRDGAIEYIRGLSRGVRA